MSTFFLVPTPASSVPPLWMTPMPQTKAAQMYLPFLFNPFFPGLPHLSNAHTEEEILPDFKCDICLRRIPTYSDLKEHIEYHKEENLKLFMKNAPSVMEQKCYSAEVDCNSNSLISGPPSLMLHEKRKKEIDNLMYKKSSIFDKREQNWHGQKRVSEFSKFLGNSTSVGNDQDCLKMKEVDQLSNSLIKSSLLNENHQDSSKVKVAYKPLNACLESSEESKNHERFGKNKVSKLSDAHFGNSSPDRKNQENHRVKKVLEPSNKSLEILSLSKTTANNLVRKGGEPSILFLGTKNEDILIPKKSDEPPTSILKNSLLTNKFPDPSKKIEDDNSNSVEESEETEVASTSYNFTIFPCSYCLLTFNDRQCLRRHIAVHREENDLSCISCKTKFACLSSLRKHFKMFHCEKRDRRLCPYCSYRCFQSSDLEKHIARKHTRDFRYKCQFCVKGFTTPKELSKHLRCKHHSKVVKTEKS